MAQSLEGSGRVDRRLRRVRVGLDIDGVLCDHVAGISKWVWKEYGVRLRKQDVTSWDVGVGPTRLVEVLAEAYKDPAVVEHLPVVHGAQAGVRALRREFALTVISTRPDYAQAATLSWLRKRFGKLDTIFVRDRKTQSRVDVLVDDYPRNVTQFAEDGRLGILLDQPWNRALEPSPHDVGLVVRARGWEQVVTHLVRLNRLQAKNPSSRLNYADIFAEDGGREANRAAFHLAQSAAR